MLENQFELWLQSEDNSEDFKGDVLRYLQRNIVEIKEPFETIAIFSKIKRGKRRLVLALPDVPCEIDLKIPSEHKIIESLRKLSNAPQKDQALHNALLDSGLRLVEAVESINSKALKRERFLSL